MRPNTESRKGLHAFCEKAIAISGASDVIVEIGGFLGESAEILASHFGKVFTIDPWLPYNEPFFAAQTMDEDIYIEYLNRTLPLGNVVAIRMPSPKAAVVFEDDSLDVVYIDGNHNYEPVFSDLVAWTPKLKKGGVIGGHDFQHPPVRSAVMDWAKDREVQSFEDTSWLIV